jgi:sialidase-1
MLLRRSTDGGRTWLPVQLVHEEGDDQPIKFGNPCPVVDLETKTVLLTMNRSTGRARGDRGGGEILIMESRDEGQTWSPPRDVTSQVKDSTWRHYAQGPGIGIQITRGSHRGRLVVPANYRTTFDNADPSYSHVMLSDDHGRTWRLGGIVGPHTNECQVVEIVEDGRPGLMINMRNHWGRAGKAALSGRRLVSRSFDGGATWSEPVADDRLIEPTCQASILRYAWPGDDAKSVILFSNPGDSARKNLTVRASYDEGRTWAHSRVLEPGSAAYSCLTRLPDGRVGVLYERGDYGYLTFAAFPVEWLTK